MEIIQKHGDVMGDLFRLQEREGVCEQQPQGGDLGSSVQLTTGHGSTA